MKINIGPYKDWFGPYQLAEKLCFWAKDVEDEHGIKDKPEWVHKFGEWLAHGSIEKDEDKCQRKPGWGSREERKTTLLYKFLIWLDKKKKRKHEIHIDPWDTWSMDSTLSPIILAMLKQLKETKHGSPNVDDKDVPKRLRSTEKPGEDEYDTDGNWHERWDWVLSEMIWAFEQLCDEDNEDQFYSGEHETVMVPLDKEGNEITDGDKSRLHVWRMDKGPNDTWECDYKAMEKHNKRIQRGTTLFGKYYRGLWD